MDLSICTILKDEAQNLPSLMACLPLGEAEWIAVDTGSRDATCALLEKAGVKPHAFTWVDDFSAARNASLALATRGWILWLDADDRPDAAFWKALEPLLAGPSRAYRFVVRSPREDSRGDSFRQIRLFPAGKGISFEGRIHEQLGTSLGRLGLEVRDCHAEILHLGYDTPAKREAKLRRNHALLLAEKAAHPRDAAVAMEYGNCLNQLGDHAGAKSAYLELLPSGGRSGPESLGTAPADEVLRCFPALLGETCAKLKDAKAAEAWFRLACRWNPSDLMPRYRLGKSELEAGNIPGALEIFYQVMDREVAVTKVASDNATVRRNALGFIVLCEMRLFGPGRAPRAREALRELIAGGLAEFPLDYRVAWEFFRAAGPDADLEDFGRGYLKLFPGDLSMWEDFTDFLVGSARFHEVLNLYAGHPALHMRSGTLEAFRGRSLQEIGWDAGKTYAVYRDALAKFPEDPTLLVYFSDFVNHNKLYSRCYADLKAIPHPPEAVADFLRQLEAKGLAAPKAS